ncbi:hypothetical protein P7K49_007233 [Saguinus oedipus]|uniref:RING-type E3 ubiquitin transferase n=1 Tax=Saguinus oedipus TaxID=9490 RepID=A0ABQ9VUC4_SAGOE|nr:hypothetical protein P7K49_007233 [Saguinus oedipus]
MPVRLAGPAMASASVAECLQQETTCPVCLQYFSEPMMLDCGHNICGACLARCWGAAETNVSCPQCRETFPQRHLRPNRHLANVTQLVKQLRSERPAGPGGEMGACEKHREPLKLYCEQDQTPICVVCDRSREHRGHSVLPLEEAVEGFKGGGSPGRPFSAQKMAEPDVGLPPRSDLEENLPPTPTLLAPFAPEFPASRARCTRKPFDRTEEAHTTRAHPQAGDALGSHRLADQTRSDVNRLTAIP